MKELINKIIDNKTRVYFISPHLDDAVLSCGELITELSDKIEVVVVNVFTEISEGPLTFSARAFLKQCGKKDAKSLFEERKKEDKEALGSIGARVKSLGFVDAQWRKKGELNFLEKMVGYILPEFIHIYPVYRWHIANGKISNQDNKMIEKIKIEILDSVGNDKNFLVFCPIAIGGNVDHQIVRDCCLDIFDKNLILWADFPYSAKAQADFDRISEYRGEIFASDKAKKDKLLRMYQSQYDALVKDGMGELKDEKYYFKI